MSTLVRASLSLAALGAYAALAGPLTVILGEVAGEAAVAQMTDSASAAARTQAAGALAAHAPLLALGLLVAALALIWLAPARRTPLALLLPALAAVDLAAPTQARAYYSKYDYSEYVEILPNWTAFLIAEVGDTRANQAQFMSERYLTENKVPAKRVQIPHTKLPNTGALADYYVPGARLIIVDRTPVSREWTASAGRGTSHEDQGFRFETADSIGLSTSIVVSAFVKEEDAAKFLYWFGTKPPAQDSDEARFASVLYGRSLSEVVDSNVHRTVQAVLAREFGRRSTDDALRQKAEIMIAVEAAVKEQFAPMGVTITTLGYADELSFANAEIQRAIDDTFMANKRAQSAEAQMRTLPIQQQILDMDIRRSDAAARQTLAGRWNGSVAGALPSWIVLPSDLAAPLRAWLGGTGTPAAPAGATAPRE